MTLNSARKETFAYSCKIFQGNNSNPGKKYLKELCSLYDYGQVSLTPPADQFYYY